MKVAVIIEYIEDKEKEKDTFASHRAYLRTFLENGSCLRLVRLATILERCGF